ncbi:hypothetical protein BD309DRAFT_260653 [Dichomitus squalens]|uniref:Uncharacterized protein n=2 Tax=Dichomitus squalens TaxID=114155 RepID=A0A4Q9NJX3_9APHY|nr:hypothetical protein BD309DRAFT_260653 [Dichomitus squalens]TBU56715.1 hypothetical protein BD310DRAFT_601207 [Dichomitus squalens]
MMRLPMMSVWRSLVWDDIRISGHHLTGKVDRCRTAVNGARPLRIPHSLLRNNPAPKAAYH